MRVGRLIFGLKMVVRWSLTVDYNGHRQNVRKDVMFFLLPPAMKLMQDVCDSVHRGVPAPRGVCSWGGAHGGAWSGVVSTPGGYLVPGGLVWGVCSWGVPGPGGLVPGGA